MFCSHMQAASRHASMMHWRSRTMSTATRIQQIESTGKKSCAHVYLSTLVDQSGETKTHACIGERKKGFNRVEVAPAGTGHQERESWQLLQSNRVGRASQTEFFRVSARLFRAIDALPEPKCMCGQEKTTSPGTGGTVAIFAIYSVWSTPRA